MIVGSWHIFLDYHFISGNEMSLNPAEDSGDKQKSHW